MDRRIVPVLGLLAGMLPTAAFAQTSIDKGKTPAQIFANDCAVCHKATRGLARGKNSATLAEFLREHYTTGREQAAALAAYVLGAGGVQKPTAERGRTLGGRQAGKPEEGASGPVKTQHAGAEDGKPLPGPDVEPDAAEETPATGRRSAAKQHERRPPTVSRKPETTSPAPAPATAEQENPAPASATPAREPAPAEQGSAAASGEPARGEGGPPTVVAQPRSMEPSPAQPEPGDTAPVPRDNIPD